jgi:hypothetical protein
MITICGCPKMGVPPRYPPCIIQVAHDLVLKPMVTWGTRILGNLHMDKSENWAIPECKDLSLFFRIGKSQLKPPLSDTHPNVLKRTWNPIKNQFHDNLWGKTTNIIVSKWVWVQTRSNIDPHWTIGKCGSSQPRLFARFPGSMMSDIVLPATKRCRP